MTDFNDFESPECTEHTVTIGEKSAQYKVRELTARQTEEIFSALRIGNDDAKAKAAIAARTKLIAACVLRGDGSEITVEQAKGFRAPLVAALEKLAMEVNGLSASENASAQASESGT